MRKIHVLLTMLMLICFSVGQGWAQASKGATLFSEDFSSYSANDVPSGSVTAATGRVVYGDASVTYACTDGDGTKPGATKIYNEAIATGTAPEILVGKYGSGGSTGGSFSIAGIPSGNAKEITVSYKQNKQKLKVAVSGTGYSSDGIDAKPAEVGTVSFDITVGDGAASTFTLTFSAYSSNVRVDDIVVTVKTAGGSSTTPSFDASPAAVAFGNVLENTETDGDPYVRKEVTLEGANLTDKVYLELNNGFKIYDPTKAAGNVPYMSLTPNASGVIDTTIIVEMYTKQTGTFNGTLSITSEKSTPEFTEIEVPLSINLVGAVTSYDIDFEAGMMDVYTNWNFSNIACVSTAITAHGGTYYGNTDGKSTASITTKSKVALPGTLTFYISKESNNTTASSWVAQVSSDGSIWTDVETFDAKAMDKGVWNECTADLSEYSNVYVRISYGSSSAIRAIDDISLAMRTPAAVENPSISGKTPFYKTTTVTIECVTEGAEIHYTTDGSEPTGGDNTYHNPFEISATKTVKAIAIKGVEVSDVVSKTFTKAEAISVTAAIALIPNADDAVADQFVEGYVCTVGTSVSSGQMTYYISADGTETNRLQVFKGKALNNADFTSAEDLAIGDKVVVYGELKNYKGTPEMNSGNYIVEKVAKGDVQSVVISGEATHGAYEGGDAFDPAGLKVTATYASGYQEDVTASATWSPATITTQSGNTDVTATFGGKTSAAKTVNITLNKYTVTFNTSVYGGTWGIKNGDSSISSGNHFPKGTVLTVVTEAVAGYKLGSITVNEQPLEGNEITIGTENITVAVEFAKVQEGVLVLSTNSLNWGTIKKGTSPLSVQPQTFTLTGSKLTEGRTVKLTTPDWCYLTQTTANPTAGGNIATTSFYVYVKDATLEAAGEYSGNIVISSDDLTADSLIAVSLKVEEATPSISVKNAVNAQDVTSIDFGNVDKGASVNQFNISLVGHNLTGDVKVTVANATSTEIFVTNGFKPSNTYYQSGGEIDAQVLVIPYTSKAGGEFSGTLTFHSESDDFEDIVIPLHINIKPDAGLAWSAESANVRYGSSSNEYPTLSNPNNVAVSYESTNESVATINESGSISLKTNGSTTIKAIFAGNDNYLAAIVSYTLNVSAGIVTITPNYPVALDLGDVIFGDERTKYGKSFHVHIENLTAGQYNQVKVTFSGAFYCAGNESITDNDQDGVIDADVTVIPSAYYWTLNMASVLGTQNGTIGLVCTGTRQFEDIQVGTVTMNVVAPQDYSLKNNWNGGEWDWKQMSFANGVYSLSNVVFGGSGVNWRAGDTGDGEWIAVADFLGDKIGALDTVTLVLDPAAETITATLVGKYTIKPDGHTYSVVGAILPNGWDEKSTITEMAFSDGVYSYKLEDVTLSAGTANEYKIVQDHAWTVAYPQSGNASFSVEKTGKYDVTFTLTLPDYTYAATPVLKEELVLNKTFVVLGGFNSWTAEAVEVAADAATASFVVNIATAADYEFKVKVNDAWLSNNYSYHRDFTEATGITGNLEDMTLKADAAGEYTFTWTFETNALSITFPEKTGTAIDQTEAEMRPTKIIRDNKVYILRGDKIYSIQGHLVQ